MSTKETVITFRPSAVALAILTKESKAQNSTKTRLIEDAVKAYWGGGTKTLEAVDGNPEAIAELVRRLRPPSNSGGHAESQSQVARAVVSGSVQSHSKAKHQ